MPLNCDCYDGCWGDHSIDWPSIEIPEQLIEKKRQEKFYHYPIQAVVKDIIEAAQVPYGSAVTIDNILRLETEQMLEKVKYILEEIQ